MGLKIFGVDSTLAKLKRTGERTHKRLLRHMRNSARDIRDLAREYAPVDEGNLEEAIDVFEAREGFRGRAVEYVGVDPSKLGDGYHKAHFRYDIRMHEGSYNLGPRSQAKAEASGKLVGPKYLARAWQELEPDIIARAKDIAADIEDGL